MAQNHLEGFFQPGIIVKCGFSIASYYFKICFTFSYFISLNLLRKLYKINTELNFPKDISDYFSHSY